MLGQALPAQAIQSEKTDSLLAVFTRGDSSQIAGLFNLINEVRTTAPILESKIIYNKEKLLKQMLEFAQRHTSHREYIADVRLALGFYYVLKNKHDQALEQFYSVEHTYDGRNEQVKLFHTYYYLSTLFYRTKDYDYCLQYARKAELLVHALDSITNSDNILNLYNIQGLVARQLQEWDLAITRFEKALQKAINHNNEVWIGILNGNIGSVYYHKGNYIEALKRLNIDVQLSLKYGQYESACLAESTRLKIYLEQQKMEAADSSVFFLENILQQPYKEKAENSMIYASLSLYYERKENYKKAFDYKQLQLLKQQQETEEARVNEVNQLKAAFNNEKQEQLIEQQENSIASQQQYFIFVGGFAILLFILLAWGWSYSLRQKRMLMTIQEQNNQLQAQYALLQSQQQIISEQNQRMTTMMGVKDKIFSIISHDLRNPISSLKMLVELLEQNDLTVADFQEMIKQLSPQIAGLYDTIHNLLIWSSTQLQAGLNADKHLVLVVPIVEEILKTHQPTQSEKKIEISVKIPADARIWADANHLRIILRNLISNALKFTPRNGKVWLSFTETNQNHVLCVSDNGVGMSDHELQRLFQPQQHFTKKGTENERGTGLGLFLVKDFVEMNGGTVQVDSLPGQGTSFYLVFPKN